MTFSTIMLAILSITTIYSLMMLWRINAIIGSPVTGLKALIEFLNESITKLEASSLHEQQTKIAQEYVDNTRATIAKIDAEKVAKAREKKKPETLTIYNWPNAASVDTPFCRHLERITLDGVEIDRVTSYDIAAGTVTTLSAHPDGSITKGVVQTKLVIKTNDPAFRQIPADIVAKAREKDPLHNGTAAVTMVNSPLAHIQSLGPIPSMALVGGAAS